MDSERKASSCIKRVDYMNVYTSDLVAAVRNASGNIGTVLQMFNGFGIGIKIKIKTCEN